MHAEIAPENRRTPPKIPVRSPPLSTIFKPTKTPKLAQRSSKMFTDRASSTHGLSCAIVGYIDCFGCVVPSSDERKKEKKDRQ